MKILSLGAVLLDQVAPVDRFPKEDDEVFVSDLQLLPGGSAANFAVIASRLGAETGFIGKIGDDFFGEYLLKDLKEEKIDTDAVPKSSLPTGTVFIAVRKDGERMMFAHSGAANDLSEQDINLDYLAKFDHLHLADLENVAILSYAAKKFTGTISINPGALMAEKPKETLELIKLVDVLICSKNEAMQLSGAKTITDALEFFFKLGPEVVVITRGAESSLAFDGKCKFDVPVFKVPVLDATGAGDAFSAAFICRYYEKKDIEESLRFANATASITVQNPGAREGLKDKAQVEALL